MSVLKLHNKIATLYKERLLQSKLYEQLYEFKVDLSKLTLEHHPESLEQFESYYLLDKHDFFWFGETFLKKLLKIYRDDKYIDLCKKKYVDIGESDEQIPVYSFKLSTEHKDKDEPYRIIHHIIASNKRQGAPRKKYTTPDGMRIDIALKSLVKGNPNQGDLLDLLDEIEEKESGQKS